MRKMASYVVLGLALMGATGPAQGQQPLMAQAQRYVAQQLDAYLHDGGYDSIERSITVMSPRGAALEPCPTNWQWEPLNLRHWSRMHIGVKCQGQAGSLVAVVHAQAPVWLSTRALPQGHRLAPGDLQQQVHPIDSAQEINRDLDWPGRILRKPLAPGTAVRAQHLAMPVFARKGEKLEIRVSVEGVTVSMTGIASRTAHQGETLRARNLSSQQWVTGRLIAPGVLEPTEHPQGGVTVQSID